MAGLTNESKALMLDAFGEKALFVSLHTDDPSDNGSWEMEGGSPAYARKAITWSPAINGFKSNSESFTFNVPAFTSIVFIGYWSAEKNGTFYGSRSLEAVETFATQGAYTVASGALTESIA